MTGIRLSALVAAVAVGTASFAVRLDDPFKPGKNEQVKLGQEAAAEVRKKNKILPDSDPRVREVRAIFNRLKGAFTPQQQKEPWKFSIDVIDSKEVNAFAFPGGPMFFYTGLLDKLKTEDAVAGILGHEMQHVFREHWAYAVRDAQKRQLLGIAILGLTRANRTVSNIAGLVDTLGFALPHSRHHENQADSGGFELLERAGYNPEGLIEVFQLFQSQKGKGEGPEWISTHPGDANRITRIRDLMRKSGRTYPPVRPLKHD